MKACTSSRLPGFFALAPDERRQVLLQEKKLLAQDFQDLDQGLNLSLADRLSENVIGTFSLPFSIAANFVVDGQGVLVPMVTEEPSIVAASSKIAKIVTQSGGFTTRVDASIMKGQVQCYGMPDSDKFLASFLEHKAHMKEFLNQACASMVARGGGVKDIDYRMLSSSLGPMFIIEPRVDVKDAMGANIVNHLMELLGEYCKTELKVEVGLRILSNYADERLAESWCSIPFYLLDSDEQHDRGEALAKTMQWSHALAEIDPYRAVTHNKGIMNGIDACALATGNDFRALEAGAHAYAAKDGVYRALTALKIDEEKRMLHARLKLPLALGVVGGITKVHPGVHAAHKILGEFALSSARLASVMASVGLAQCLGALLALSSEGIQKGHMRLHKRKEGSSLVPHANT